MDGFFHADPHPGNFFYLPGDRIALIDFGMVGRLGEERRREIADLMQVLARRDVSGVVRVIGGWAGVRPTRRRWANRWRSSSTTATGTAIVMTVSGGPTLLGLPLFGLPGFAGSGLGGMWLLASISRSGHMRYPGKRRRSWPLTCRRRKGTNAKPGQDGEVPADGHLDSS